jgi:transcriptional regulator with XRE-family HTH domain
MVKFSEWLDTELEKKEWTRADLARHAHVRQSTISMVYSGNRNVGLKLANAIAAALKLQPITVFRAARITSQEVTSFFAHINAPVVLIARKE